MLPGRPSDFLHLANFDQFDFGELSISLLPKSSQPSPIEVIGVSFKNIGIKIIFYFYNIDKQPVFYGGAPRSY